MRTIYYFFYDIIISLVDNPPKFLTCFLIWAFSDVLMNSFETLATNDWLIWTARIALIGMLYRVYFNYRNFIKN